MKGDIQFKRFAFLVFSVPRVRQAKPDVSYQLKGTDHGNYSFAM
jgi:hypothetical protein